MLAGVMFEGVMFEGAMFEGSIHALDVGCSEDAVRPQRICQSISETRYIPFRTKPVD